MNFKDIIHKRHSCKAIVRFVLLSFWVVGFVVAFTVPNLANAEANAGNCGPIYFGQFGPFDYRTEQNKNLATVEEYHFTPNVEALIRGNSGSLGSELDYTLSRFPNHHRALMAMMRLGEKEKTSQPRGAGYPVECWFERALRFRPDDNVVRQIYATYLIKNGRESEAIKQLEAATKTAGDNAFTHYNAGLIYFDMKDYGRALTQAHMAYRLGLERHELRDRLKSVGKWSEHDDAATTPASGSSSHDIEAATPPNNSQPESKKPDGTK